eukprot:g16620.t1
MALPVAQGTSSVAGAEVNVATGTRESTDHHRLELRQHSSTSAVGLDDEGGHPAEPPAGGGAAEEGLRHRRPDLKPKEHSGTTEPGQEECLGRDYGGGDRRLAPRGQSSVLRGSGDGVVERLAKPPCAHPPGPHTMDAIAQNSLLGALLSYQDGVAGATYADGDRASRLGHLGLVKMQQACIPLVESGKVGRMQPLSFTPAAMDGAAASGHLEVARWLHYHREEGGTSEALIQASANGHKDVVEWLLANRGENDVWRALGAAAESSPSRDKLGDAASGAGVAAAADAGILAVPRSRLALHGVGHTDASETGAGVHASIGACSSLHVAGAAQGANDGQCPNAVLEALLKALPPGLAELSTREWVSKAAAAGRVDFLEWLKKKQEEARLHGIGAVFRAGETLEDQVQDDHEKPLEYPSSALAAAARGGHIEILHWFLENGVCSEDPTLRRARRRRFHGRGGGRAQSGAPTKGGTIRGGSGDSNGGSSTNDGGSSTGSGCSGSRYSNSSGISGGGGGGSSMAAVAAAPAHGSFLPDAGPPAGGDGTTGGAAGDEEEKEEPSPTAAASLRVDDPPALSGAVSTNRRRFGEHDCHGGGRRRPCGGEGPLKAAATARLAKLPLLRQLLPLRAKHSGSRNGDGGCEAEGGRAGAGLGAEASGRHQVSGLGRRWGSRRGLPTPLSPRGKVLTTTPAVEDAAANAGHLKVLEWLNAHAEPAPPPKPSQHEQRSPFGRSHTRFYGKKSLAQWRGAGAGAGPGRRCSRHAFERACEEGHFSMAVWLASRRSAEVERAYDCIRKAATNGHLEIVAWLSSSRDWNPSAAFRDRWAAATTAAMDDAAAGGHLTVVRWLHEHRSEGCTSAAMDKAAAAGHLEMLQWLHRHRQEGCTTRAMDLAAAAGHTDVVEWLHENRDEGCSSAAMDGAAEHNRLPTLEWLRQNRVEGWTLRRGAQAAARNGNLTALSYLLLGGKEDAVQGYDDGFGGFAAYAAAESPTGSPVFDPFAGGSNDFEVCRMGEGLGGAGAHADEGCCEGSDGDVSSNCLHLNRPERSEGPGADGRGGGRTEQEGGGTGAGDNTDGDAVGGGDVAAAAAAAADANAGADPDASVGTGSGADAIDGLRLAGGGRAASPVTLDLDEAAAEGRLEVLQWARRATMEASPSPCSRTGRWNGSGGRRSRNGGRGCGGVCCGYECGRYGRSSPLHNGDGDEEEKGEVNGAEVEEEEEQKEEEKEATGEYSAVLLRCWGQKLDGGTQRDQETNEEEEGWQRGASRLKDGAFSPPGYCSNHCHDPCRCREGRDHRHRSGSVLLSPTAAAPTAIAATAVSTAPVSPSRDSPAAPVADGIVGGDGGGSDGAASVVDADTGTAVSPAAPSDAAGTIASPPLDIDDGDASADTAGCRGSRCRRRRRRCTCERQVADDSQATTDSNGWRYRGMCWLVEDTAPVGDRRRRQGVTGRETVGNVGATTGGTERAAPPPSLGAGKNRFRVAFSTSAVDGAAGNGHLEVVRWLLFHRREGGTAAAFETAAVNGHVHVLEWLMTHTALRPELRGGSPLWPSALAGAAANGHLGVIRWFHRNMSKIPTDAEDVSKAVGFTYRLMDEAAANGHLQICRWLRQHRGEGCSWNAFDGAAAGGHMHVLCWLDEFYPRVGPSAIAFVKVCRQRGESG